MQMQLTCWWRPEINISFKILFSLACTIVDDPQYACNLLVSLLLLSLHNVRVIINCLLNYCWIPFGEKCRFNSQLFLNIILHGPPCGFINFARRAHDIDSLPGSTELFKLMLWATAPFPDMDFPVMHARIPIILSRWAI